MFSLSEETIRFSGGSWSNRVHILPGFPLCGMEGADGEG